ncbi:unnamed protein product, partial [Brassica oleracea]
PASSSQAPYADPMILEELHDKNERIGALEEHNTTILSENATIHSENATILAELASQMKFNTEIMQNVVLLLASTGSLFWLVLRLTLSYLCANVDDGECHVWKWWDVAVIEEMRARDRHTLELAEKVDFLTFMTDYETEQKLGKLEKIVSELGNKNAGLTNRFAVIKNPSNLWDKSKIANIMKACIILHNMIVEDERRTQTQDDTFQDEDIYFCVKMLTELFNTLDCRARVRDRPVHKQLKLDLIENIWDQFMTEN